MAEKSFHHVYLCRDCKHTAVIEHPDDFLYIDECDKCGSDELELQEIIEHDCY